MVFTSFFDSKAEPPRREPYNFVSSYYLPPSKLPNQINKSSWYDKLLYDVERSGLLLIESERLVVIPSLIPDSVAASFSVPFQTAFSLVRRSNAASSCSHALVTAPSSATSLKNCVIIMCVFNEKNYCGCKS